AEGNAQVNGARARRSVHGRVSSVTGRDLRQVSRANIGSVARAGPHAEDQIGDLRHRGVVAEHLLHARADLGARLTAVRYDERDLRVSPGRRAVPRAVLL